MTTMVTRILKTAVIAGGLTLAGIVAAESLSDFEAANKHKQGCETIPYSSLRSTCQSKSRQVNDYCKGGRGKWNCDGLDPKGLTKQIDNVKKKLESLKREKSDLERKKSSAKDDAERRKLDEEISDKDKEIRELEGKVSDWERKLSDEKKAVSDRIYVGEKCLDYRQDVERVFRDAKSKAKGESDPKIKPIAQELVKKYEAGERGHAEAIALTEKGIDKCKSMR